MERMEREMKYIIDIDNTICNTENSDYENSQPITENIHHVNSLYDLGHEIVYWTARGGNSGIDHSELTKKQLAEWGCKYTDVMFNKPVYDIWVDDKAFWIFDDVQTEKHTNKFSDAVAQRLKEIREKDPFIYR